ncbi:MAG: glycoside hydrolase family 3 C-terminal domain-containing protein, partial [Chloroflexota bacterium]
VLLKNEHDLLPIADDAAEIAVIGAFAKQPRYQGAGSSQVMPERVENLHDELVGLVGERVGIHFAAGYDLRTGDVLDPSLLREAQDTARRAHVAVVVVGLPESFESEGSYRARLDLPAAHNALVDAVLEAQPRTVVVVINGSAVAMPWAARAPAIVEGWLGGQGGGGALADVLLGRVNPSGKLAETFPERLEDTPTYLSFPGDGQGRVRFAESLFIGYRWYDARRIEPLFPFGHGLSYTTFAYSDLAVSATELRDTDTLDVSVRVRNTGQRAGKEVVQLYLRERAPYLPRPDQELKAFAIAAVAPGDDVEVRFQLIGRYFAIYDPRAGIWVTKSGIFDLLIGASSRDIRLRQTVELEATNPLPVHLDRLSPLHAWLANPAGRAALQPAFDHLHRRLFGAAEPTPVEVDSASGGPDTMSAFLGDMPIGKLVTFGVLDEEELARLIASVNA